MKKIFSLKMALVLAWVLAMPYGATVEAKGNIDYVQTIEPNQDYYLVPASHPNRSVTHNLHVGWDYVYLTDTDGSTEQPSGTPIRLKQTTDGKYLLQSTTSNHEGYDTYTLDGFPLSSKVYVYLNKENKGVAWEFKPQGDGFQIKAQGKYLNYLNVPDEDLWVELSDQPLTWFLLPVK